MAQVDVSRAADELRILREQSESVGIKARVDYPLVASNADAAADLDTGSLQRVYHIAMEVGDVGTAQRVSMELARRRIKGL